jgi:hypothetical protein
MGRVEVIGRGLGFSFVKTSNSVTGGVGPPMGAGCGPSDGSAVPETARALLASDFKSKAPAASAGRSGGSVTMASGCLRVSRAVMSGEGSCR